MQAAPPQLRSAALLQRLHLFAAARRSTCCAQLPREAPKPFLQRELTLTGEGTALHSLMHPSPTVRAHDQRECARRAELVGGSPDMPMQTAASAEKKSKKECVALATLRKTGFKDLTGPKKWRSWPPGTSSGRMQPHAIFPDFPGGFPVLNLISDLTFELLLIFLT